MKKALAAIILLVAICLIYGVFNLILGPYARGNQVAEQGRELLRKIEGYRTANGHYPDQRWFQSLGEQRYTVEDRIWTYFSPPLQTAEGELLLMTPLDYKLRYSFGIAADGDKSAHILNWDARSLGFSSSTDEEKSPE